MVSFKIIGALLAASSGAISASTDLAAKASSRDLIFLETRDLTDHSFQRKQWSGAIARGPNRISETTKVSLECLDCRTWGTITAELNDYDFHLHTFLHFTNVGGYFDFGLAASANGTYVFELHRGVGDKKNITTSGWHFDIGLTAELIIQVSASVEASGGFQFAIPDGSTGLKFDFGPPALFNVDVLPLPTVNFGLLPVSINDTAANITAAIRLRAHTGVSGETEGIEMNGEAGAFLNLAQVTLGETSSSAADCKQALFADVESNAGAYAHLGICEGEESKNNCTGDGPEAATVFYRGGTTGCLPTATGRPFRPTAAAVLAGPTSCHGGATGETVTTSKYLVTSCAIATINCPAAYAQTIEATNVETITTTSCPGAAAAAAAATDAVAVRVETVDKMEHPIRLVAIESPSAAPTVNSKGTPKPTATAITGQYAAWAKESEQDRNDKDGNKDEKNAATSPWQPQSGLLGLFGFAAAVMVWL
ncbi:hypothetical protein PG994_004338 [Apiospora phragmitis]|uniref:Uncharacterized protein n=1 Tax=Apiospora phragmitis TaxID=2905665 RepID=A0ABR1VQB8_9PEZI